MIGKLFILGAYWLFMQMEEQLQALEIELKKRLAYAYNWHNLKQNDSRDRFTDFIYTINSFDALLLKLESYANRKDFEIIRDYAMNRWFNFWSAMAVEEIFCTHSDVIKEQNRKDFQIDFTINGIAFDHKTSVFPNSFNRSIDYAQQNKLELINWFYKNQSTYRRQHFANRLFIVLYASNGKHWKLKAEITWLQTIIENYLHTFSSDKLINISFAENIIAKSDVIWAIR